MTTNRTSGFSKAPFLILGLTIAVAAGFLHFATGSQNTATLPGDLLAKNRTHLSICVDHAGVSTRYLETSTSSDVTTAEVRRVSNAVEDALGSLEHAPPEFGQPTVTGGCPAPIMLTGERLHSYDLNFRLTKVFTDASKLSPHRIFVYFVPDTAYSLAFGNDGPYAKATAELLCEGDACGEMTVSIYAPESIADDDLANAVLRGLALEPRTPEPTMDWASCEHTTARPECGRYLHCLASSYEELQCKNFWDEAGITPPPGQGGNPSR